VHERLPLCSATRSPDPAVGVATRCYGDTERVHHSGWRRLFPGRANRAPPVSYSSANIATTRMKCRKHPRKQCDNRPRKHDMSWPERVLERSRRDRTKVIPATQRLSLMWVCLLELGMGLSYGAPPSALCRLRQTKNAGRCLYAGLLRSNPPRSSSQHVLTRPEQ